MSHTKNRRNKKYHPPSGAGWRPDRNCMVCRTRAYAHYVKAMKIRPLFIKQAATFFGPGEHYAAGWTPPVNQPKPDGGN